MIIRPIKCPRCQNTIIWDGIPKQCNKCLLDIVEQGATYMQPKQFGVVIQLDIGKYEVLLIDNRKGQK